MITKGKRGVIGAIAIVLLIIVVAFLIFTGIFGSSSTPTGLPIKDYNVPEISINISKDDQLRERFLRQTYFLSQVLSREQQINTLDTGLSNLDKVSTAVYSGSVITQSLKLDNFILKKGSTGFSRVYNARIVEVELNNIIGLHNNVITASNEYNYNSTIEEANEYLALVGEHAGKTVYLALRSDAKAAAAFIDGLTKISSKAGIKIEDQKIKDICGEDCYNLLKQSKDEIFQFLRVSLPFVDHALFEAFGILGRYTAPSLMKATSFSENELYNEIIPKAKEFQEEIVSQIQE